MVAALPRTGASAMITDAKAARTLRVTAQLAQLRDLPSSSYADFCLTVLQQLYISGHQLGHGKIGAHGLAQLVQLLCDHVAHPPGLVLRELFNNGHHIGHAVFLV
eukprot:1184549-Prorocentrum_minimum.AAC.3